MLSQSFLRRRRAGGFVTPLLILPSALLLILLTSYAAFSAETGESTVLLGRVVDAASGAPLANANVSVQGSAAGTMTMNDGWFSLRGAPDKPYTLVVSFIGYEPLLLAVDPASVAPGESLELALQPTVYATEQIVVTASRYGSDLHLSQTNIPRGELQRKIADIDIPLLLEDTPGLYASSDAGNGIGYTYLKIRGFDQRRVGVMVNGIPLNDPEDHQVYWVDLPDLASSLEDVQVQRGVTNSLGGMAAIGGTVNLVTDILSVEPRARAAAYAGSYGTAKQSLLYNTGLVDGRFSSAMRISHLESDGYRDRSGSDQWAVFWSGRYQTPNSATQVNIYTGREKTLHAWDAIDEDTLENDRTYNPETYVNAVDDFRQPHYELHHRWNVADNLMLKNSAFVIHGEGFYENFKDDRQAGDFGLDRSDYLGLDPGSEVDLVRRKWVRKDQVGWVPQMMMDHSGGRTVIGGDVYTFHSNHWGDVISVEGFTPGDMVGGLKYHEYTGDKVAWSAYVNERWEALPGFTLMADMQFQHKRYEFMQEPAGSFQGDLRNAYTVDYDFFNPKGGFFWDLPRDLLGGDVGLYGHVGQTHREPADNDLFDTWDGPDDLGVQPLFSRSEPVDENGDGSVDYVRWYDPQVLEEKVLNWEGGFSWRTRAVSLTINGYWMDFENEIVPYGGVDEDGLAIRGNADKTLHRGIEMGLAADITPVHRLRLAASKSWDEYDRFSVFEDVWDWDTGEYLGTTETDYSGNPIPLFPDHLLSATVESDFGPLDTSVRLRRVGKQHLDNTGQDNRVIDAYTTVDLGLSADLAALGGESLSGAFFEIRLRNLFDVEYETNGYYDPWSGGNMRIPAAKRNFLAGIRAAF